MKVKELIALLDAKPAYEECDLDKEVQFAYTCDLLSWVMARGCANTVWVTVQTHLNVVAIASLLDMSCVIIPDSIEIEAASLEKAKEECIPLLSSEKSAFEICGILYANGLIAPASK